MQTERAKGARSVGKLFLFSSQPFFLHPLDLEFRHEWETIKNAKLESLCVGVAALPWIIVEIEESWIMEE